MNPSPLTEPLHDVLTPHGAGAAQIASLWWLYLTILTVVTLLVLLAVALAIGRSRLRQDEPRPPPALRARTLSSAAPPVHPHRLLDEPGERRRRHMVLAAACGTLVVLFVLLTASIVTSRALTSLPRDAPVHVELTAAQWWWKVRYLNGDPSQIFVTANELHVPVGRPISIRLASADVIHSFWVPSLHGKRDVIPGHESTLWLRADAPGVYRGQCAEFCGLQHANMALTVVAEQNDAFERWSEAQRAAPAPPESASAQRGQLVFQNGPCGTCHTVSGTAARGSNGPDLSHLMSRPTLGAGTLPNTRGHRAGWIVNSQALKPGNHMPSVTLLASDLNDLLAYLETLR